MQSNSAPVAITFLIYLLVIFVIALLSTRRTRTISDFVVGGRKLSGPVAALGAGTSDMSSWLLMALPALFLLNGLNQIWLPISLACGAYFNWVCVAKRLRIYSALAQDSLTIPSYLEHRFLDNTRILRMVTALVILLFFTAYCTAGFISGALLLESTFGISYISALLISATVIMVYTCMGGFIAVSWVDFFQGILMFIALLLVPYAMFQALGGWDRTLVEIAAQDNHFLEALYEFKWIPVLSLFAWGLGYAGQPHILVRFMSVRSSNDIFIAKFICMGWMILALYGALFTGFAGIAYFKGGLEKAETVFLVASQVLFNPWIAGFLIAAVLSAIMSTISAQLLASSSALVEDFYHVFLRQKASQRELLWASRVGVVLVSLVAIVFALDSTSTIMQVVEYAWSGLGGTFGPVILVSLYWSSMTLRSAISGLVVGALTVILWHFLFVHFPDVEVFKITPILPAFILNSCTIYVVSVFDKGDRSALVQQHRTFQKALV